MKTFRRILVATDLSPASVPAVEEAMGLASKEGANLIIAHVYEPPTPTGVSPEGYVPPNVYDEWDETLRNEALLGLQPLVEKARQQGLAAEPLVLRGVPYAAIAEAARSVGADLVVLGTHGRTGVQRLLLGSVAAKVISTAPCPVLTVRAAA
jgi:universal stress protein A